MTRSVIDSYYVNMDKLDNLSFCYKTFRTLLVNMGWKNALVLREQIYLNFVRVFYSNMIISSNTASRIVTNVVGIPTEFDVKDLNMILRTKNEYI